MGIEKLNSYRILWWVGSWWERSYMIFTQNACNMNVLFAMFVVGNGSLYWQEL